MPTIETRLSVPPKVIEIAQQYQTAVGILNNMFDIARVRTTGELWRLDGVGSCVQIHNKEDSEIELIGPAKKYIVALRETRNQEAGGHSILTGCPYHREGIGCVLGNLKSPVCIQHFENWGEWRARFGINAWILKEEIDDVLNLILTGHGLISPAILTNFTERIEQFAERIKLEPDLYQVKGPDKNSSLVGRTTFWQRLRHLPKDALHVFKD